MAQELEKIIVKIQLESLQKVGGVKISNLIEQHDSSQQYNLFISPQKLGSSNLEQMLVLSVLVLTTIALLQTLAMIFIIICSVKLDCKNKQKEIDWLKLSQKCTKSTSFNGEKKKLRRQKTSSTQVSTKDSNSRTQISMIPQFKKNPSTKQKTCLIEQRPNIM